MEEIIISNFIELWIENIVKSFYRYPKIAQLCQNALIYPRFYLQLTNSRIAYLKHRKKYSQYIIFICGLPKSGTTWLDQMLAELPGFNSIMLPGMHYWGMRSGGSHDYELSLDEILTFDKTLSIIKTHSHGSLKNTDLLRRLGIRYVIMYRDIRDVAVSYVHFVRERPWHPEYKLYIDKSIQDGILFFAQNMSSVFSEWIKSWYEYKDSGASIIIQYEQMLKDPKSVFIKLLNHYDIKLPDGEIDNIFDRYQQSRLRQRSTHFRKGIIGDWENYFSPEIKNAFKENIGDFLVEFGYEQDMDW